MERRMIVAICDDNPMVLEKISGILRHKYEENLAFIEKYTRADDFLEDLEDGKTDMPDILFMDICLDEGERAGIYAAKKVKKIHPDIYLIFMTGYLEYVPDIFLTEPDNLLMKPLRARKVIEAIERAKVEKQNQHKDYIYMKANGGVLSMQADKIIYLESKNHDLFIHLPDKVEHVRMKMDDMMKNLPDDYIRIHKSFCVNIKYLKRLTTDGVVLLNDTQLPVSRSRYDKAKEEVGRHLLTE